MKAKANQVEWPADKVERWPLSKLIPYARNARLHSPEQVQQIAASMRQWGWTMPVLAGEDGGIIAGHGRVAAAEINGYKTVPVMVAFGWTEEQKRSYIIADNQLALNASWDREVLGLELFDLKQLGVELDLIGFSGDELDQLLREATETVMPELPTSDRTPYQQVTFTLHDKQVAIVREAVKLAKSAGATESEWSENSNGNALTEVCQAYINQSAGLSSALRGLSTGKLSDEQDAVPGVPV